MSQTIDGVNEKPTKVKIDNYEINYSKIGNGSHVLLLCPGLLGDIGSFKPIIDNFDREKYTMVAWDPPGYGLSRPPYRDYPLDNLHRDADLAVSLMEALRIDRYSVLGWCNGGCTALILAASRRAAGRLRKAVVWSCNAYVTASDMTVFDMLRDVERWPSLQRQYNENTYGMSYFKRVMNAWVDWNHSLLRQQAGEIIGPPELADIDVPTLILHGTKDGLVPLEQALYLHRHISTSSLEIFPEGKHILHFMMSEKFNAAVQNFLATTTD